MLCEHQFGFKRRENGQFYCSICRAEVYDEAEEVIRKVKNFSQWLSDLKRKGL